MAAKKQLNDDVKRFIVMNLAMCESPSDVMTAVKETFNVTITRAGVQNYDPTKVAGRALSEELKTLFVDTRAEYKKKIVDELPLMDKYFRVKKLSRYVENAESIGNEIGAAALIEQIAKEDGGMFSNKHKHDVNLDATLTQTVVRVPPKITAEQWKQSQLEKS